MKNQISSKVERQLVQADKKWMRERESRGKRKIVEDKFGDVCLCVLNGRKVFIRTKGFTPSPMEARVESVLKNSGLFYLKEVRFGAKHYYYDFFIPSLNLVIEYDGVDYHSNPSDVIRDAKKSQYLKDMGLNLECIDKTRFSELRILIQKYYL